MTTFPPDDRLTVTMPDGSGQAHCGLWWRTTPAYHQERVGVLGDYAATSAAAANDLLQQACERLAGEGCTLVVGPLDGSTWATYRFVVEAGEEPPFFLEPHNPPEYPQQFRAAGFETLACYTSTLIPDLRELAPLREETRAHLAAQGIVLRQVAAAEIADPQRFALLLRRVYPVVCAGFAHNLLYQPISEAAFCQRYLPLRPLLRPDFLWLAEHHGRVVGFLLALPDMARAQAGQPLDTVILKTLVVLPNYTGQGIGSLLCELCQYQAASQGYRRAIHALMPATSHSQHISRHAMRPLRRYALFARAPGG